MYIRRYENAVAATSDSKGSLAFLTVRFADGRHPTKPGRVYQLALEEAFFLCHTLQCLDIHSLEALEVGYLALPRVPSTFRSAFFLPSFLSHWYKSEQ